jgi:GT2 family glycosyltransferase/glycosyltransferase involved in cell wall biosynthesis
MANEKELTAYRCDDFLILHWQRAEPLPSFIRVFLNKEEASKPLFGAHLADRQGYLLVAKVSLLEAQKRAVVRVFDPSGNEIAASGNRLLRPLAEKNLRSFTPAARMHICQGLLKNIRRTFELSDQTLYRMALALSIVPDFCTRLSDRAIYFRLPYLPGLASREAPAVLRRISPDGGETTQIITVFLDNEWLHGVMIGDGFSQKPVETLVLELNGMACIPFRLTSLRRSRDDGAAMQMTSDQYNGDFTKVRCYVERQMSAGRRSSIDSRNLEGYKGYKGRIDGMLGHTVVGWAYNEQRPDETVRLDVYLDKQLWRSIAADSSRIQVRKEAKSGNCGFAVRLDNILQSGYRHLLEICYAGTQIQIDESPFSIGKGFYDGDLYLSSDGTLWGWVKERQENPEAAVVEIKLDGRAIGLVRADEPAKNLQTSGLVNPNFGFKLALPGEAFHGDGHEVTIEVLTGGQRTALDKVLKIKNRFEGGLDRVTSRKVAGWIINKAAPARAVNLDLCINRKLIAHATTNRFRHNVETAGESNQTPGFEFDIPTYCLSEAGITVSLFVSGTNIQVLGPSIVITPYDLALRSLMTAAEALNNIAESSEPSAATFSAGLEVNTDITYWIRSQVIARLITELRKTKTIPGSITLPLSPIVPYPRSHKRDRTVDIIIPVYRGCEETLRCIRSVLEAENDVPTELTVINDSSPDPELTLRLRDLAAKEAFTLLENSKNQGFVETVNRGMRVHPERDVVLLNADTIVPSGWIDRLRRAAYADANTGTATPFSNKATICSFPKPCVDNALPEGLALSEVDALFSDHNAGMTADLPTAVGFCMFIKRDALDEVGYFDAEKWGRGYGEENDFCLRASALGWRHVVACNVFVQHDGSVSFAHDKEGLIASNLPKLNGLYPDYAITVRRFIAQDPLARVRNRVAKALLKRNAQHYMLFVMHALGGGAKVAADDLAGRLAREHCSVLELSATAEGRWELSCFGLPYSLIYRYPDDLSQLVDDLRDLRVWHVHYHQTMHFPMAIWNLPQQLDVRYDFTAHDYLPICPRINLIDETGFYCDPVPSAAAICNRCVEYNGLENGLEEKYNEFGNEVGQWRIHYARFLANARRVFAPSEDTARRYREFFSLENLVVQPHPEPEYRIVPANPPVDHGVHSVAVIGAIGDHKGYRILLKCVRSAKKEGLPLRFVVIGYTCNDAEFARYDNTVITGEYEREQLPRLIEQHHCKVAAFLSPWPETYSYTLSEALRAGLYPVAFDLGAIAERIKNARFGAVIPLSDNPKLINKALLDALQRDPRGTDASIIGNAYPNTLRDYYSLDEISSQPPLRALSRQSGSLAKTRG